VVRHELLASAACALRCAANCRLCDNRCRLDNVPQPRSTLPQSPSRFRHFGSPSAAERRCVVSPGRQPRECVADRLSTGGATHPTSPSLSTPIESSWPSHSHSPSQRQRHQHHHARRTHHQHERAHRNHAPTHASLANPRPPRLFPRVATFRAPVRRRSPRAHRIITLRAHDPRAHARAPAPDDEIQARTDQRHVGQHREHEEKSRTVKDPARKCKAQYESRRRDDDPQLAPSRAGPSPVAASGPNVLTAHPTDAMVKTTSNKPWKPPDHRGTDDSKLEPRKRVGVTCNASEFCYCVPRSSARVRHLACCEKQKRIEHHHRRQKKGCGAPREKINGCCVNKVVQTDRRRLWRIAIATCVLSARQSCFCSCPDRHARNPSRAECTLRGPISRGNGLSWSSAVAAEPPTEIFRRSTFQSSQSVVEHRMPNAEHRMPNAECRMPNAECPVPSAKCQVPSAFCLPPSPTQSSSSPSPPHTAPPLSRAAAPAADTPHSTAAVESSLRPARRSERTRA